MSSVSSFVSTQCKVHINSAYLQFAMVLLQLLETAILKCSVCEWGIPENIRLASGDSGLEFILP